MVERVQTTEGNFDIVVATTIEQSDEPIRSLCRSIGVQCYSGHPTDLLDRHYKIAKEEKADCVVKIPSDCPLIDPAVIEKVLRLFHENAEEYDFVSNLHPASYPDGNDVEVIPYSILEKAWLEAEKNYEREHTTPFVWEKPERFRIGNVLWEAGLNFSMSHRWTIDYHEDYEFIKTVYDELWSESCPRFSIYEILALLDAKPHIHAINSKFAGVNWYRHHLGELKTVSASETRQLA
jgi:spore coat polysaccharide biosynthesis protein SpsF